MWRPARRLLFAFASATFVAACSDSTSPTSETGKLAQARERWASHAGAEYSFTLRQNCFCAVTEPVRVTVDHDTVVSAVVVSTQAPLDKRYVQTIAGLFDFIDRSIAGHAAVIRATYNAAVGFPWEIVYDQSAMAADDEGTITVSDVVFPK